MFEMQHTKSLELFWRNELNQWCYCTAPFKLSRTITSNLFFSRLWNLPLICLSISFLSFRRICSSTPLAALNILVYSAEWNTALRFDHFHGIKNVLILSFEEIQARISIFCDGGSLFWCCWIFFFHRQEYRDSSSGGFQTGYHDKVPYIPHQSRQNVPLTRVLNVFLCTPFHNHSLRTCDPLGFRKYSSNDPRCDRLLEFSS